MIPLPPDVSTQDIEQWCSRGVVMALVDGEYVPAFFRAVSPGRVIEVQKLGGVGVLVRPQDVSVHWPRCGSVNIPRRHFAVHVARVTARQYRRTWHVSGVRVTTPRAWEVARFEGANFASITVSPYELAEACFCPHYPTLDDAEARLTSGESVTVALTPSVIVAGDPEGKRMFYHHGELVATGYDRMLHPIGRNAPIQRIIKLMGDRYRVASNF